MILRSGTFGARGSGYVINAGWVVHGNGDGLGIGQPAFFQKLDVGGIAIINRKAGPALAGDKGCVRVHGDIGNFMLVQHGADEMADTAEACDDNAGLVILRRCFQRFRRISPELF